MLVLAIIIMAAIQILKVISVNDILSMPAKGDMDKKDIEPINFNINKGND